MAVGGGPFPNNEGLVFGIDTGYGVSSKFVNTRFNQGEPTINLNSTAGLTGMGISVTYVGDENGWKKYSLSGTWSGGTYPYSMHISNSTFTGGTYYSVQLKIKTNVLHKFNYFGDYGLSYVNQPKNDEGAAYTLYKSDNVGLESELERLVVREGFAYTSTTSQPGYLYTNPKDGATFNSSTDFVWIKDILVEQKQHCSPYTNGTRSSTESLVDLKRSTTVNVANVSFNSTAQPTFDGTNDYIDIPSSTILSGTQDFTIESVYNKTGNTACAIFGNYGPGYTSNHVWFSGAYGIYIAGSVYAPGYPLANGKYHMVATRQSGAVKLYLNGNLVNSGTLSTSISTNVNYRIGLDVNGTSEPFTGDIYTVRVYNKALTAQEIQQNYQAYKNRFAI